MPDEQAEDDIQRGMAVLSALSDVDIGQAVVVQQGIVLGRRSRRGHGRADRTLQALKRDGQGGVLVKFSKRGQETRVDMPTIGPETMRQVAKAGLRGVAVGAGTTIILDVDELVRAADDAGVFIIGVARE